MQLMIGIFGGVTLMLWGIRMVRTGVMRSFGAELRRALSLAAGNSVKGFAAGFLVTAILQSSAATALMLSSFAGRGLIGTTAALAVMLGADVGTTMVVQLLSLDLGWLSPILIGGGVVTFMATDNGRRRNLARVALGLGLVLLALQLIGQASASLRASDGLTVVLQPLADELILAVLLAAALTWLAHSSIAVVLFVMSLAALDVLPMPLSLALVLGANLGGAIVPVVATMAEPPAGRRVVLGNLLMRTCGVAVAFGMLPWLPSYLASIGDDTARMVANFHTVFNLGLAVAFLPLLPLVNMVCRRLVPEPAATEDPDAPRYLDPTSLETPSVALACASREALAMGDAVRQMLVRSVDVFRTNDDALRQELERSDDGVDRRHEAIKLYLTRISKEELDDAESQRNIEVLSFTTNLEHIGDIIDKNLMDLAAKKIRNRASFSDAGFAELEAFHGRIVENFDLAMNVFMSADVPMARSLIRQKVTVRDLERTFAENHYTRIGEGRPDSIDTSALHLDVLRDLKRINSHLTAVAYPILERVGELSESRLRSASGQ